MKKILILIIFSFIGSGLYSQQTILNEKPINLNIEDESLIVKPTKISKAVYFDSYGPLKSLPKVSADYYLEPKEVPWQKLKDDEAEGADYSNWEPMGDDPVWQKKMGSVQNSKGIGVNFPGQLSNYYPSDCIGTIGPNHFMQTVNTTYEIYDRSGVSQAGPTDMNLLFAGVTGASNNDGDPLILWDEEAGKWLAVEFSISDPIDYMLVAVSQTSDPTGLWWRWSFVMNGMPDYEKIGIWEDGYYMSTNTYTGDDIYVFERQDMIVGGSSPQMVQFENPNRPNPSGFHCLMPFDNDGAFAPAGTPGQYITINDNAWGGSDELWVFEADIDWVTPNNSTFGRTQQISVSSFDSQFNSWGTGDIEQTGTTQLIDANPYTLQIRAQYKNWGASQSIVCVHVVDVDATNHAGLRWYELENTGSGWSIVQEGTYAPDANSRWEASIAMNDFGQIGMGFNISSSSMSPEIRFCGQSSCAPSGVMDIAETAIPTSLTPESQPTNRYGDYSLLSVDPNDNLTFWYTTEYFSASRKRTQIASFTLDEACAAPTMSSVSSSSFFRDKGKEITVNGTDLLGCDFVLSSITGTQVSNDGSTAVINFPPGNYDNSNILVVSNIVGNDNTGITVNTRTTIPVDAGAASNTDTHQTIQSATDGLAGWMGTNAFTSPITIEVASGSYAESITLNNNLNPTVTNRLSIQNASGSSPIIDASGQSFGFNLGTVDFVTLKGLQVHSATNSNIYAQGDNCDIYYNKLYNGTNASGIKIENGGTNSIHNNLMTDNQRYGLHLINSNTNTIKNNTTYNNGGTYSPLQNVELWNEGFEGDVSGWTITTPWAIYSGIPHTGEAYLAALRNNVSAYAISPSVSISGYNNIEVSFWYYCTGNDVGDHTRAFYNIDGAGDVQFFDITGSQTGYTYFSYSIPITGNNIVLSFTNNNGNSEYSRVDDIIIIGDENLVGGNLGSELYVESGTGTTIENNIFYVKNGADYYAVQTGAGVTVSSDYNTYFANGNTNLFNYNGTIGNTGPLGGNDLTTDPLFVSGDYHLQSSTGSYTSTKAPIWPPDVASGGVWSNDAGDSPAIDAGNPADAFANEPADNGGRINQGVFGNTTQGSKGPPLPCVSPDVQASVFTTTAAGSTSIDLSWTRGNGDNVIILAHESVAVDSDPISGTVYTANATFGSGTEVGTGNFVVFDGAGTSMTVTGLTPGATYHFSVYEYYNTDICFMTPGATANATTATASPVIATVNPNNFFADKGTQITITGTDLSGAAVDIAGVAGSIFSNDGSTLVVDFPAGLYTNNTLTVSTGVNPDATSAVTVNTRNIIPVGGGTDFHTTVQSALDGLFAWFGTSAFNTSTTGYLSGAKTIDVYNGTYTDVVTPNITLGTTAAENLIIQNNTGQSPVIDASGNDYGFYIGALDYVEVTGFTVHSANIDLIYTEGDNNTISMNKCYSSIGGTGIMLNVANTTVVSNNLVYNNNQFGVRITSSDNITFKNNTLANNGTEAKGPPLPGIYTPAQLYVESGTGTIVQNNIFYALSGTNVFTLMTESGVSIASDYNTYYKNGNTSLVYYQEIVYTDIAAWTGNGAGAYDLENDPDFVLAGTDFHIKSTNDSYPFPNEWPPEAATGLWNTDASSSPALDTGNPADGFANEPVSGGRVNQGAYGNTAQASKSAGLLWDGSTDTDWFTASNWTPEAVPIATDDIIIPDGMPNYPIIDIGLPSTAVCNNMTIAANTSVTVATDGYLTVSGTIINNAGATGLVIKSDTNGDGSLITNNAVAATVERFVTGNQWHLMFPTLSAIPTATYTTEGTNTNNNFYSFDESAEDYWDATLIYGTSGWTSEVATPDISTNQGYLFNRYNMADKTYIQTGGVIEVSDKTFDVSYNLHTGLHPEVTEDWDYFDGWNLAGNPYTSAFDWDMVTLNGIENGIYYLEDSNYKYYMQGGDGTQNPLYNVGISVNGGSRYAPMGQGFMVKTINIGSTHSSTFTIPHSARVHDDQAFFKNTESVPDLLRLQIEKNGFTDELVVRTIPVDVASDVTEMHDAKYDAYKMFAWDKSKPQLFSLSNDFTTNYAINTLPEINTSKHIPLGVYIGEAGDYAIKHTENNFDNMDIYLHDIKLDKLTKLEGDISYTFNSEQGELKDRFELIFEKSNSNIDNYTVKDLVIYPNPNSGSFWLTVDNKAKNYSVEIHNLTGQVIYTNEFVNSGTKEIKLDDKSPGVYFIKVVFNNNYTVNKKIIIQ